MKRSSVYICSLSALASLGILVSAYAQSGGNPKCCGSDDTACADCRLIGNADGKNLYVQIGANAFNRCLSSDTKDDVCTNDLGTKVCYTSNGQAVQIYTDNACKTKAGMGVVTCGHVMCTCGAANTKCGCK